MCVCVRERERVFARVRVPCVCARFGIDALREIVVVLPWEVRGRAHAGGRDEFHT